MSTSPSTSEADRRPMPAWRKKLPAWFGAGPTERSYEEWKRAAIAADEASGQARWKEIDASPLYDHTTVRSRLDMLRRLRGSGDDAGLMAALDDGLHGNLGGMGRPELYAQARYGTKRLITSYIDTVCEALRHVAASPNILPAARRAFIARAQVCFGHSALLLSGGGRYGNFHVGVVRVLIEHGLLPKVISGSSAGALIAAIVGTHSRDELAQVLEAHHLVVRGPAPRRGLRGLLPQLDLPTLTRHVERLVPDLTFAEAAARSGALINISVSPAQLHQLPRLLNAATTPHVLVRSAVMASCAVPGVFPPAMLVARNANGEPTPYMPERRWYDGSMHDDIPALRLSRLYGVNHAIVSQVNPFALPLSRQEGPRAGLMAPALQFWQQSGLTATRAWLQLAGRHGRHFPRLSFAANGLASVLSQRYTGNITILPRIGLVKVWRGMAMPDEHELAELIIAGQQATWPEVEMIRNCTRIGHTLETLSAGFAAEGILP